MVARITSIVERYLLLGLCLGRHVQGLVDAYYGPPELARRAAKGSPAQPSQLVKEANRLLVELEELEPERDEDHQRMQWLRAQVLGMLTTAQKLAGERIGYLEEVERCYGITPTLVRDEEIEAAHERLAEVLEGPQDLAERFVAWRESHAVAPNRLSDALFSLAEDLRYRTASMYGLPEAEQVDFELVTNKPWAGFNSYLGGLRSRVEVNVDLPVLSNSLAHLVAHEAYPGHHTEHCRKEVGLVRQRRYLEETIFLVGTPQCVVAEGLADLGLEVVIGQRHEHLIAEHLHPLGIRYDAEVVAAVAQVGEVLSKVRANAAFRLHVDGADPHEVSAQLSRWALVPLARARKTVEFLMHPVWRAYVFCYTDGLPLCRRFVGGDRTRPASPRLQSWIKGLSVAGWRSHPDGCLTPLR